MSKRRRNEPHSDEEYVNGDEEPPSKRPRTENGAMDTEEYLDYKTNEEVRNFIGDLVASKLILLNFNEL
jgi:hypothetical protein